MKIERLNQFLLSLSAAGAIALAPLAVSAQMGPDQPAEQPTEVPATDEPEENGAVVGLLDQIRERDDMTEIAEILDTVGFEDLIDEGDRYTFLLPNDDAFAELEGGPAQGDLETLVRSHIARGKHSAEALRDGPVSSLGDYRIEGTRDLLLRTEVRRIDSNGEAVGERARIVDSGIEVNEGVLHVVNRVWTDAEPATTGQAEEGDDETGGTAEDSGDGDAEDTGDEETGNSGDEEDASDEEEE